MKRIIYFLLLILFRNTFANSSGPTIVNIAPDFIDFWATIKDLSTQEKVSKFESDFFDKFSPFYEFKMEKWKQQGKNPDEELGKQLDQFGSIEQKFKERTQIITREIDSSMKEFLKYFPDLDQNFTVYITHSLGEMDGGTRIINGKLFFIFGIDSIVKYHNASTDVPFFHHELFHIYHHNFFSGRDLIWHSLWTEGLATYISEQLNPGSDFRDIMLDIPVGLVPACEQDRSFLLNDITNILESDSETDYINYFLLASTHTRIPIRAGYYLGYLVAREIGRKYSLKDLSKLDGSQLLSQIRVALSNLK